MVANIKSLTLDSNELKAKMSREAREVGQAFETKAFLQKEVSAMKELVAKIKEEFNSSVEIEKEEIDRRQ